MRCWCIERKPPKRRCSLHLLFHSFLATVPLWNDLLLYFHSCLGGCAQFQRLEAIYQHLSQEKKIVWEMVVKKEPYDRIALGATARRAPGRRFLLKLLREGPEEGRLTGRSWGAIARSDLPLQGLTTIARAGTSR